MASIVNIMDAPDDAIPVNLDHVVRFERLRRNPDMLACFGADGQKLGQVRETDIPTHPPVIVEERRGTNIVRFSADGEMRVDPVISWHITDGVAVPITYEPLPPDGWCLEITRAGVISWVFPDDQRFGTLDEAREYATQATEPRRHHALRAVAGGAL